MTSDHDRLVEFCTDFIRMRDLYHLTHKKGYLESLLNEANQLWHSLCVKSDEVVPALIQGRVAAIHDYPRDCNPHDVPERIADWYRGYDEQKESTKE